MSDGLFWVISGRRDGKGINFAFPYFIHGRGRNDRRGRVGFIALYLLLQQFDHLYVFSYIGMRDIPPNINTLSYILYYLQLNEMWRGSCSVSLAFAAPEAGRLPVRFFGAPGLSRL